MQENIPGKTGGERNLNRCLLKFLKDHNKNGNLEPPQRERVEGLSEAINTFYSGVDNKSVRVYARHIDLKGGAHFVTNVSINGKLDLCFDPNGGHSPDGLAMLNHRTNLHKPNGKGQGECGLWCIAAMVEIGKEKSKKDIITKAKSKELTRRITARFINLKQTMVDKSKFISLGESLNEDLVNTLLQEGQKFIREDGMRSLNSPEPITMQQNQVRSVPPPVGGHNVRKNTNVTLYTAARTITGIRSRSGVNGNPQMVETPDSEFKTIKKSKAYNNILETLKQKNMQKLAENMQIIKTPVKNKEHKINQHCP